MTGITSDYDINFRGSFYDRFIKNIPNKDIKNPRKLTKLGQALASPHWNRLVLGAAAISTQPFIDLHNKKVDEDTAKISSLRTTAKIIACTSVGFCVRGLSFAAANKFIHGSEEEGSTLLTPTKILKEKNPEIRKLKIKLHKNTSSTLLALFVMMFTNFLLDAPLTTKLANKFISNYRAKQESEAHE